MDGYEMIIDREIIPAGTSLHIVRKDRNRRVAILLSGRMRFKPRFDISEGKLEFHWIELFLGSKRALNLCCVYRPPSQYGFYEHLWRMWKHTRARMTHHNGRPRLKLTRPITTTDKHAYSDDELHDLVQSPTRITQATSSQLDHMASYYIRTPLPYLTVYITVSQWPPCNDHPEDSKSTRVTKWFSAESTSGYW